jgi:hypothetical protein
MKQSSSDDTYPAWSSISEFERRVDHLVDTEPDDPKVMPLVRLLWSLLLP